MSREVSKSNPYLFNLESFVLTQKRSRQGAKTIATSAVCDIQKVKWNFAGSLCMLDLYDNTS